MALVGRRPETRTRKGPAVVVAIAKLHPDRVEPGGTLSVEVAVRSISPKRQRLSIRIAVEAPHAGRPKVLALDAIELDADESETLRSPIEGTRSTGRHHVDLLVNGVAFPLGGFSVIAERRTGRKRR